MVKSNTDRPFSQYPTIGEQPTRNGGDFFVEADKHRVNIKRSFQKYAKAQDIVFNYSGHYEAISLKAEQKQLLGFFFKWLSHCIVYSRRTANISVCARFDNDEENVTPVFSPLRLIVESEGIGISPETLARVFYCFCRSESKRISHAKLSAGLLFSKVVFGLEGGTISVESRKSLNDTNVFTRFVFLLAGEKDRLSDDCLWLQSQQEECRQPSDLQSSNSGMITNTSDDEFLSKLMALVESHISDPDFNVSKLATEIGMSRPVLFRKAKILTGSSIINLIRSRRLQMAEMLLKQRRVAVSEVAFKVGYRDPKYFSKSFRSEFGKTPKEYVHSL